MQREGITTRPTKTWAFEAGMPFRQQHTFQLGSVFLRLTKLERLLVAKNVKNDVGNFAHYSAHCHFAWFGFTFFFIERRKNRIACRALFRGAEFTAAICRTERAWEEPRFDILFSSLPCLLHLKGEKLPSIASPTFQRTNHRLHFSFVYVLLKASLPLEFQKFP